MLLKTESGKSKSRAHSRLSHDRRIFLMALLAGLPAVVIALILVWTGSLTPKVQWTLTLVILAFWLGVASELRERVVFPLQTLSNLLAALREGDFSIRGRHVRNADALAEVTREVNTLAETLREQRLGALVNDCHRLEQEAFITIDEENLARIVREHLAHDFRAD